MARTAICNLILGKLLLFLKAFDRESFDDAFDVTFGTPPCESTPRADLWEILFVPTGSPPSKVYGNIRAVASRAAERF